MSNALHRATNRNTGVAPSRVWMLALAGCLVLAIAVLAMVGFWQYDHDSRAALRGGANPERGFFVYVWFTLSTFLLRFPVASDQLPLSLEVARVLAPLVLGLSGILALVTDVWWRLGHLLLLFRKGHVVIVGARAETIALAEDIRAKGMRVVFVDDRPQLSEMAGVKRLGLLVAGDAAKQSTHRFARMKDASRIVVMQESDSATVGLCVALARATTKPVVHGIVQELAFIERLALGPGLLQGLNPSRVRLMHAASTAARRVLAEHPLDAASPGGVGIGPANAASVHVVMLSNDVPSDISTGIALQAARIGHFANGTSARLWFVGPHARAAKERACGVAPALAMVCEVQACEGGVGDGATWSALWAACERGPSLVTIAACDDDDDRNLEALGAMPPMPTCTRGSWVRVLVHLSPATARVLGSELRAGEREAVPFCILRDAMTTRAVFDDAEDLSAKAVHEEYLASLTASGSRDLARASHREWHQLASVWRNANRSQVDHASVKLRAMGLALRACGPAGDVAGDVDGLINADAGMLEALAVCEHQRWVADRLLAGWRAGAKRDDARLVHDCIVPYVELSEAMKQRDRDTIVRLPALVKLMGMRVVRAE